jgi:hypothetical protein
MNMNSYSYQIHLRLFGMGTAIWALGTLGLRLGGHYLLRPDHPLGTLWLFALSLPLMAWLVRRLCLRSRLPREEWLAGAVAIALPTLFLDPFSSAFFPSVFPNMAPQMAGVFGGWMLWCCAGAFLGVLVGQPRTQ